MVHLPPLRDPGPAKPVRVHVFSPLGKYPKHAISIPGARLLVSEDLIMSAVHVEAPEAHGLGDEHFSELEFLALEEMRFLGGIVLAVRPDDDKTYTYPLYDHVDVDFGLDDNALMDVAQQLATRICRWSPVPPPACGGPAYRWCEAGVNVARVLDVVCATELSDRRAVARYAGLTGSPDESGARRREQGLARAGNARIRRAMIQLA